MPPKYNWTSEANANDRDGNVRRITTDAGRQEDRQRTESNPYGLKNGDKWLGGGIELRFGDDQSDDGRRQTDGYDPELGLQFRGDPLHGDDRIDRRYLVFPEAAAAKFSEEQHKRSCDLLVGNRSGLSNETTEQIGDFVRAVIVGGKDAARAARNPYNRKWLEYQERAFAEGTVGSPGTAGTVIPPGYIAELMRDPTANGVGLYGLARKIPVATNEGKMPTLAALPEVGYVGEATELTEDTQCDLDEISFRCYKRFVLTKISREAAADSNPACVELLRSLILESLQEERERCVAYGSGSSRPTGLYHSSGITDVSGITSISYENLNKLYYSVSSRYREDPSFVWTFNSNVEAKISALVDSVGRPILVDSPAAQAFQKRLYGKPVIISDYLPNTFIGCGAMRNCIVTDRNLMMLEATTDAGDSFVKDQVWLKLTERQGGNYFKPASRTAFARSKILSGITALQTLPE